MRRRFVDPQTIRESGLFLCVRISNRVRSYCRFHLTIKWIIQGASVKPVKTFEGFHANTTNPSNPSGYFTYHQLQHSKFLRSAHTDYVCSAWTWKQTAIISLHITKRLVFVNETECVYGAVRTGSLIIIQRESLSSILGQSMWYQWWTKWKGGGGGFSQFFRFSPAKLFHQINVPRPYPG